MIINLWHEGETIWERSSRVVGSRGRNKAEFQASQKVADSSLGALRANNKKTAAVLFAEAVKPKFEASPTYCRV